MELQEEMGGKQVEVGKEREKGTKTLRDKLDLKGDREKEIIKMERQTRTILQQEEAVHCRGALRGVYNNDNTLLLVEDEPSVVETLSLLQYLLSLRRRLILMQLRSNTAP